MRVVSNNSRLYNKITSYARTSKRKSSGTTSSKTTSSKTGTTETAGSLKIAEMSKNYNAIKNAAASLQTHASKLLATGDDSLFGIVVTGETSKDQSTSKNIDNSAKQTADCSTLTEAELSENKDNVFKEINSFVEDYNTLVSKMSTTGGMLNNLYLRQIKSYATQNRSSFKEIGITQKSNGTLSVNQKNMKAADTAGLQKVFGVKDCFAAKVSVKSESVESNANTTLTSLKKNYTTTNYNKYGYLSGNSTSSGNWLSSKG